MDLAHGALETFGKLAVVLAELRVAVRLGGAIIPDIGRVLFPEQHQRHAFAAQFKVNPAVIWLGKRHPCGCLAQQAALQLRLVHALNARPVQSGRTSRAGIF